MDNLVVLEADVGSSTRVLCLARLIRNATLMGIAEGNMAAMLPDLLPWQDPVY